MTNHRLFQLLMIAIVVTVLTLFAGVYNTLADWDDAEDSPLTLDLGRWRGVAPDGRIFWADEIAHCRYEGEEISWEHNEEENIWVIRGIPAEYQFYFAAIDTESTIILKFQVTQDGIIFVTVWESSTSLVDVYYATAGACEDD